jgi:4-phosphopantoate--beta-alanine ligase
MDIIPDSHPRAASLRLRHRLVEGLHRGIVTETGLIAHGRGEALDYLLGERTHPFAQRAVAAASAMLTLAKFPVMTVNGNVAGLSGPQLARLAENHPRLGFEVNLFHYTPERAQRIVHWLRELGLNRIIEFGESVAPVPLPGIDSMRRFMHPEGVAKADVVLVALEDGDRCGALVASGRNVIAIDLNPLSRTAQLARISVIDELTRVLDTLDQQLAQDRSVPPRALENRLAHYDNHAVLEEALTAIRTGFKAAQVQESAE